MVYPNVRTDVQVPAGTPNGTLFICVAQTYGIGIKSKITKKLVSLEDCARGYWRNWNLSQAHADKCEWLMAHCGGEIQGVWKIDRTKGNNGWLPAKQVPKPTWPEDSRNNASNASACHLIPVDGQMRQNFVGKAVHLGRAFNPLRGYFI